MSAQDGAFPPVTLGTHAWYIGCIKGYVIRSVALFPCLALLAFLAGCTENGETDLVPAEPAFRLVHSNLDSALLSVWGTSGSDVWTVGGDARDGTGPLVLHYDGTSWERMTTGQTQGDLWWIFGFEGGPIYMGGSGGVILRYESGTFTLMSTPNTATVFGIWGATQDDPWAVGGVRDTQGFAWRLSGDSWVAEASLPAADVVDASIWKVFGRSANEAWLVGSYGVSFAWDGATLARGDTGVGNSIFTVHANAERYVGVGGLAGGFIVENDGTGWALATESIYALNGVCLSDDDSGYAVGAYGLVYQRNAGVWREVDHELDLRDDFHSVWIDPAGGAWAVGGCTMCNPLENGMLVYKGEMVVEGGL